eukprot:4392772-Amphidinium_carterae.1
MSSLTFSGTQKREGGLQRSETAEKPFSWHADSRTLDCVSALEFPEEMAPREGISSSTLLGQTRHM